MKSKLLPAAAGALAALAVATPALAGWSVIGVREVKDRTERDTIVVEGRRAFDRIKLCVQKNPVHFIDVDIHFRNGGHQDVQVAERISPGQCTRAIELQGGDRDIARVDLVYEETSFRRARAKVKLFAE
jgi:hypothetical protein